MTDMHFPGRDVNTAAEYADNRTLKKGHTYFRLHFEDNDLLIPTLTPMVFMGHDLFPNDSEPGQAYFQDPEENIHTVAEGTVFVLTFERALDLLLVCSLRRQRKGVDAVLEKG